MKRPSIGWPGARLTVVTATLSLAPVAAAHPSAGPTPAEPQLRASVPEPSASSPVVHAAWYDTEHVLGSRLRVVAEGVRAFCQRAGVALIWRRGETGASTEDAPLDEVPILLVANAGPSSPAARPVLGSTATYADGSRVVYVFLDAIRAVLGLGSRDQALTAAGSQQLAQSVARVVAHELSHVLAPRQAHGERGLMKRALSRADLLTPLGTEDARALRAALPGGAPPASAPHRCPASPSDTCAGDTLAGVTPLSPDDGA